MNKSAAMALGALVLVAGGALVIRSWGRSAQAPAARPAVPAAATAAAPGYVLPADGSAGSLALRWVEFQVELQKNPPVDAAREELARSRERQFADEIQRRLDEDPSRWADVLEVVSEENPAFGRMIVDTLRDAVGDGAERELLRLVKAGRHRETRMASATLVAGRSSNESLWSLVASAREDPDAGVRYQSLSELLKRQGRNVSDAERNTIDQEVRWHAHSDPDPAIRQFALRATGQASDAPAVPPPARVRPPGSKPGRLDAGTAPK